ncbi:MAG: JDVT-CTERM system CAAX-type protease [Nitrospinae bacterium]|nr:JDVT-CTERM system CAAX-type protease [Nitrospinota bacterium]
MGDIARALGLYRRPLFYRDVGFLVGLLASGLFWLILWLFAPVQLMVLQQIWSWGFLSLALWQPLWEEVLFRGVLQGQLWRYSWGRRAWRGITVANGITSALFMLGHFWHHPPLWAIAVLGPSLIFGYVRDRYASVYPAMVLHAVYNAGYFGLTGIP